jgi:signal transduction histidine kinase/ligand-binding sensor domain-containing protein
MKLRFAALALALSVVSTPVRAKARPAYSLTTWTAEKGPPGDVLAMTEDRAGYLWLGTAGGGLVRFDGAEFVTWGERGGSLPGHVVPALASARDGSLWVGFSDANGVSRIQDGKLLHHYGDADGLNDCAIAAMLEDRHGTIWIGCQRGLAMFQASRWTFIGRDQNLPADGVTSLYEDRRGALWVGTTAGIFRRAPDQINFEPVDRALTYVQSLAEDDTGVLWASDTQRVLRPIGVAAPLRFAPEVRLPSAGWRLLRDQRGGIWIAALGGGLLRSSRGGGDDVIERISYETTITGSPRSLFQDHENNIWVGMRGGGLLRLAEAVVDTGIALDGLTNDGVRAMASAPDGSVWVATGHSLNRFSASARLVYPLSQTLALYVNRRNELWAVTANAIGRFTGGHLVPLRVPPGLRLERAASITAPADGTLWLCTLEQGVFAVQRGAVEPVQDPAISGRGCSYIYTDSQDRVWMGFTRGGIAYYEKGVFHMLAPRSEPPGGAVLIICEDQSGALWFGTSSAVSRFSDGRFVSITTDDGLPGKLMSALIADAEGYMWIGADSGSAILRLSRREFDAPERQHSGFQYLLYNASDGLLGPTHWASHPAVARDGSGLVWVTTGNGLAIIDPRHPPPVRRPSAPHVERVGLSGRVIDAAGPITLPRSSSIDITYGAISLSAASKIRYRYMLEGLGRGWVDAGVGRVASFENLPAGRYRFRVAATVDGVWSEGDSGLEFLVRPPFYQTLWFYALVAGCLALTIWTYWRLRLLAVRNQFAMVVAERTRLSREIHDTLLQSLGAVGVELEVVVSQLQSVEAPASDALKRLQREVGRCVREARDSIWELRSSRLEIRDLPAALIDWADDIGTARAIQVDVETSGRPHRCSSETAEQLLRITQEAVGNAIRHGRAKRVRILLDYQRDSVLLRVCDDGCGFVPQEYELPAGEHWGLTNMKERAERVGGRLTITSRPGEGTTIETRVPLASLA